MLLRALNSKSSGTQALLFVKVMEAISVIVTAKVLLHNIVLFFV